MPVFAKSARGKQGLARQARQAIPGVDWVVAAVLIAELGIDMSVFLSADHLAF